MLQAATNNNFVCRGKANSFVVAPPKHKPLPPQKKNLIKKKLIKFFLRLSNFMPIKQ